jgi:myo-inositol-1(or 4)-monophosphatase
MITKKLKQKLKKMLPTVESAAIEAGQLLLQYQKKLHSLTTNHKKGEGVVSDADFASEKLLLKKLKLIDPTFSFLAEESSFINKSIDKMTYADQEFTWMIDPLDGTTNFLAGLDYFCVSIGLAYYGRPVLAVIYHPAGQTLYTAIEGEGAFLKNTQTKTKSRLRSKKNSKKLSNAVLVTGFATEKRQTFKQEFLSFKRIMDRCRAVRRFGSAALDLGLVARGLFDGFWERSLAPWDVAAGTLICLEAGKKITDFKGREFTPFSPNLLVSLPELHSQLVELID